MINNNKKEKTNKCMNEYRKKCVNVAKENEYHERKKEMNEYRKKKEYHRK